MDINNFAWGEVRCIHHVGEYDIVEYHPSNRQKEIAFHAYINGRDACHSYLSLDAALAGCIARNHDGVNTRADVYFMRSILEGPLA